MTYKNRNFVREESSKVSYNKYFGAALEVIEIRHGVSPGTMCWLLIQKSVGNSSARVDMLASQIANLTEHFMTIDREQFTSIKI